MLTLRSRIASTLRSKAPLRRSKRASERETTDGFFLPCPTTRPWPSRRAEEEEGLAANPAASLTTALAPATAQRPTDLAVLAALPAGGALRGRGPLEKVGPDDAYPAPAIHGRLPPIIAAAAAAAAAAPAVAARTSIFALAPTDLPPFLLLLLLLLPLVTRGAETPSASASTEPRGPQALVAAGPVEHLMAAQSAPVPEGGWVAKGRPEPSLVAAELAAEGAGPWTERGRSELREGGLWGGGKGREGKGRVG